MTDLEHITREVERGLERWCEAPLGAVATLSYNSATDGDVQLVEPHRAVALESVEFGVRYQRCGGGRRVIRKRRGRE